MASTLSLPSVVTVSTELMSVLLVLENVAVTSPTCGTVMAMVALSTSALSTVASRVIGIGPNLAPTPSKVISSSREKASVPSSVAVFCNPFIGMSPRFKVPMKLKSFSVRL